MTATATASTWSSTTPPTTSSCAVASAHGLHAAPWADPAPGAHVARAAMFMVWSQVDAGHGCPISMTYSVVPALRVDPDTAAEWEHGLTAPDVRPVRRRAGGKSGLLAGMGMTEKQGGSDVRTNTTRAEPDADGYRLTGHKWFCSAPMSDVFLMLAQAPAGLSVLRGAPPTPRRHPQRDPDRAAQGQARQPVERVERDRARGRVGHPARRGGSRRPDHHTMVNHTRLDCVLGATATMRQALAQAVHHTRYREAFGDRLDHKPLMRAVLADLALETEAATATALRLARAYDSDDPQEVAFRRIATAIAKYWVCKRQPGMVAEALECLGRQRLRGGLRHAPALPGEPAQRDLGGLRQRDVPRRAPRRAP